MSRNNLGKYAHRMIFGTRAVDLSNLGLAYSGPKAMDASEREAIEAWLGHAGYSTEWQVMDSADGVTTVAVGVRR